MVNTIVVLLLGGVLGLGGLLLAAGLRGQRVFAGASGAKRSLGTAVDQLALRAALAVGGVICVGYLTRWPVAAVIAGLSGAAAPSALQASGRHSRELAKVEAIAGWVEQLRDTLSAANGLEHALTASAKVAPAAIAEPVGRLAARSSYEPLPRSLRRFADEIDHPLADFVVAALVVAAEQQARELGALLGQLAETARDEARMRNRVWVSRARNRTVIKVIGGVIVAMIGGLFVLDREYLRPYDSASGQLALAVIAAIFAGALVGMERLGRIELPDRFVGSRREEIAA